MGKVVAVEKCLKDFLTKFMLVALIPTVTHCDIPICNQKPKGDHPFCIPEDYNKDLIPATNGPLDIFVDIFIFEVSKINDIELTMTFELYFDLMWEESRFVINETSEKWGQDGSFMGSTNFVKSLWLPDIQIFKCKQFKKRKIVTDVAGLIVWKNKQLLYTVSTEVVIDCPMKFSGYPLDHQSCKFLVGSYIHDNTQITFGGQFRHDVENQRAQQYMINCTMLDENDTFIFWANRTYSQTGFQVDMIRRRTPVLLQVYLPSGLFVIVSWISFIVPPEVVPGRMALLVTLFLVLVNIFNSVTANAPKAEGLTAVETWVVSCIIHVFGVLAEYALILKIIQNIKRNEVAERKKEQKELQRQIEFDQLNLYKPREEQDPGKQCLVMGDGETSILKNGSREESVMSGRGQDLQSNRLYRQIKKDMK